MFDEKLAHALNFTEEELTANRDGYMTKAQRVQLRMEGRGNIVQLIILAIMFAGLSMCFTLALPITQIDYFMRNALFVIFILVILFCLYAAFAQWIYLKADLRKGDVTMLEGKLKTYNDVQNTAYYLTIRGQKFNMSPEALLTFQDGERYRLYLPSYSNRILSAELVQDEANV